MQHPAAGVPQRLRLSWYEGAPELTAGKLVAEETGMIVQLGEWVIRQTLAETAAWQGDFRIAINLSPTQVRSWKVCSVSLRTTRST